MTFSFAHFWDIVFGKMTLGILGIWRIAFGILVSKLRLSRFWLKYHLLEIKLEVEDDLGLLLQTTCLASNIEEIFYALWRIIACNRLLFSPPILIIIFKLFPWNPWLTQNVCVHIKWYHALSVLESEILEEKVKIMENDFLMEMYSWNMNPPLTNTGSSISRSATNKYLNVNLAYFLYLA